MNSSTFNTKILSLPKPMQQELELYLDYLFYKNSKMTHKKHPKAGCMKGTFKMKNDFDEPLDDFREYME